MHLLFKKQLIMNKLSYIIKVLFNKKVIHSLATCKVECPYYGQFNKLSSQAKYATR